MAATMPSVDDALPHLERHLGPADLVAYAGATWDWHRIHHDHVYAQALGFAGTVVDGQLFGAFLVEQLQDGLGPGAFVRELDVRYRAPVFAGTRIRCEARVTGVAGGRVTVAQQVVALPDDGPSAHVAATASAVVEVAA